MPPPPQSKPLSIDDLPTEVLALVLNHVHVKHLPKLALTNAAWGQPNVFELLWSMVCRWCLVQHVHRCAQHRTLTLCNLSSRGFQLYRASHFRKTSTSTISEKLNALPENSLMIRTVEYMARCC